MQKIFIFQSIYPVQNNNFYQQSKKYHIEFKYNYQKKKKLMINFFLKNYSISNNLEFLKY